MNVIKREFEGWKIWEVAWLLIACGTIIGLSIYWNDTLMGIISATTGVACVICTGKGKLSAYVFGLINCVLYAIISYQAKLYGETMLNAIYYVPMQFYGFYVWSKNMNEETKEVVKKAMTWKTRGLFTFLITLGTIIYGLILNYIGDANPYLDSFTTVCSIFAMIISIKMYAEQWIIWVVVNIASVVMWAIAFSSGNDNVATLLMWCVYLINAIVMLIKWMKEATKK